MHMRNMQVEEAPMAGEGQRVWALKGSEDRVFLGDDVEPLKSLPWRWDMAAVGSSDPQFEDRQPAGACGLV